MTMFCAALTMLVTVKMHTPNLAICIPFFPALYDAVYRKYHISSKQYTEEGIRLRLLGENMPSESGCIACDVTLEDAYIYVTNR